MYPERKPPFHFLPAQPEQCPVCGHQPMARISYGMPLTTNDEDLKMGRRILGGCVISDFDPKWHCVQCKTDFYSEADREKVNSFDL